jgi:hypothetical protein
MILFPLFLQIYPKKYTTCEMKDCKFFVSRPLYNERTCLEAIASQETEDVFLQKPQPYFFK